MRTFIFTHLQQAVSLPQLPSEILLLIFEQLTSSVQALPCYDNVTSPHGTTTMTAYTHVCRHWRSLALRSQQLWTFICPRVLPGKKWVPKFFERSGSRELTVVVDSEKSWGEENISCLLSNIGRVVTITIEHSLLPLLKNNPQRECTPPLNYTIVTQDNITPVHSEAHLSMSPLLSWKNITSLELLGLNPVRGFFDMMSHISSDETVHINAYAAFTIPPTSVTTILHLPNLDSLLLRTSMPSSSHTLQTSQSGAEVYSVLEGDPSGGDPCEERHSEDEECITDSSCTVHTTAFPVVHPENDEDDSMGWDWGDGYRPPEDEMDDSPWLPQLCAFVGQRARQHSPLKRLHIDIEELCSRTCNGATGLRLLDTLGYFVTQCVLCHNCKSSSMASAYFYDIYLMAFTNITMDR